MDLLIRLSSALSITDNSSLAACGMFLNGFYAVHHGFDRLIIPPANINDVNNGKHHGHEPDDDPDIGYDRHPGIELARTEAAFKSPTQLFRLQRLSAPCLLWPGYPLLSGMLRRSAPRWNPEYSKGNAVIYHRIDHLLQPIHADVYHQRPWLPKGSGKFLYMEMTCFGSFSRDPSWSVRPTSPDNRAPSRRAR